MIEHLIVGRGLRRSRLLLAIVAVLVCSTSKATVNAADNSSQTKTETIQNDRSSRIVDKESYGCASGYYLEAYAEMHRPREPRPPHGDICRPSDGGGSWRCPIGCQATGARDAPFCVWHATDIPCHKSTLPTDSCSCEGCKVGTVNVTACYSSSSYQWCSQMGGEYCRRRKILNNLESEAATFKERDSRHEGSIRESNSDTSTEKETESVSTTSIVKSASPSSSHVIEKEEDDFMTKEAESYPFACSRVGSSKTEAHIKVRTQEAVPKARRREMWCPAHQYSLYDARGGLIGCCWEPHLLVEEKVNGVDLIAALMLIGAVSFIMSLFYLVNHYDEDIRKHSWNVISSTISIFTATLIFMGISSFLDKARRMRGLSMEFRHSSLAEDIVAAYGLFLFWFMILQVVIGSIASLRQGQDSRGVHSILVAPKSIDMTGTKSSRGTGKTSAKEFHKHKVLLMKCWATLCSHISGFAAIHAGIEVQHLEVFSASPVMMFISVTIQCVGLLIIFLVSDKVRAAVWTSGTEDEFELWDETTEEAENDVAALTLSFLAVHGLRHVLPHDDPSFLHGVHSKIHHTHSHEDSPTAILYLYVASAVSALLSILLVILYKFVSDFLSDAPYAKRLLILCQSSAVMGFAWCLFFATRGQVASLPKIPGVSGLEMETHSVPMCVLLACVLSILGFVIIFFLDMIADMDATGEVADKAINAVINSIGILVGFSWERSFDESVHVIAELTSHNGPWSPTLTKLGLAITIAFGIIPAWRRHILKKFLETQTAKEAGRNSIRHSTLPHGTYTQVPVTES